MASSPRFTFVPSILVGPAVWVPAQCRTLGGAGASPPPLARTGRGRNRFRPPTGDADLRGGTSRHNAVARRRLSVQDRDDSRPVSAACERSARSQQYSVRLRLSAGLATRHGVCPMRTSGDALASGIAANCRRPSTFVDLYTLLIPAQLAASYFFMKAHAADLFKYLFQSPDFRSSGRCFQKPRKACVWSTSYISLCYDYPTHLRMRFAEPQSETIRAGACAGIARG